MIPEDLAKVVHAAIGRMEDFDPVSWELLHVRKWDTLDDRQRRYCEMIGLAVRLRVDQGSVNGDLVEALQIARDGLRWKATDRDKATAIYLVEMALERGKASRLSAEASPRFDHEK